MCRLFYHYAASGMSRFKYIYKVKTFGGSFSKHNDKRTVVIKCFSNTFTVLLSALQWPLAHPYTHFSYNSRWPLSCAVMPTPMGAITLQCFADIRSSKRLNKP